MAVESPDASGKPVLERLYPESGDTPEIVVSDLTKLECLVAPIREDNEVSIRAGGGLRRILDERSTPQ